MPDAGLRKYPIFIKLFLSYKKQILILFLFGFLSSFFVFITPYLSKLFVDKAFIEKNINNFINLSVIGGVLFIFGLLFKLYQDIIKNKISIRLKLSLTNAYIKKLYSLDFAFFQSKSSGENVYRLNDIESISSFILEQSPRFLVSVVSLPLILGISFWINSQMTIFFLFLSPLFILHSLYLQNKLRPIYEQMWRESALVYKKIHEALSRILIIKVFNLEAYQRHDYIRSWIKNIRWRIKSFRWTIISSLSSSFLSKAVYGLITLYGGWLIIKGKTTLGSYAAVMLYLAQLQGVLQSLSHDFANFSQQGVSLNKFFEVMQALPQIKDSSNAFALEGARGEIKFENVSFGYDGKSIIKNLTLNIPDQSWVAIVGPSGSGKTTLINLILRLYDPLEGQVYFDGIDFRELKLSSLREKIAIATQQPLLFDVSIRENISYGLKNINRERIEEAAKITYVHDYIIQLPKGYDTLVGEDASILSQGLKQRLAIARAILRDACLLILDEATSSVDSQTEEKIFQAIRQKRQGLSTIIISHRLFSIKDADKIYFLKNGGELEAGTHNQLIAESLSYQDFFRNQQA